MMINFEPSPRTRAVVARQVHHLADEGSWIGYFGVGPDHFCAFLRKITRVTVCSATAYSGTLRGRELLYSMSISCPECEAFMPEDAVFCPGCGLEIRAVERADGKVGALSERMAGALAYTLIAAVIFLLVAPYNKNRFVRFHSFQCIGFWLAWIVLMAGLRVAGVLLYFVPLLGHLLVFLLTLVVGLGFLVLWMVLIIKALQGEMLRLPLIGSYAELQAAK